MFLNLSYNQLPYLTFEGHMQTKYIHSRLALCLLEHMSSTHHATLMELSLLFPHFCHNGEVFTFIKSNKIALFSFLQRWAYISSTAKVISRDTVFLPSHFEGFCDLGNHCHCLWIMIILENRAKLGTQVFTIPKPLFLAVLRTQTSKLEGTK